MTSREFCYWLQGYFEIQAVEGELDQVQVQCVRKHLAMVFQHEIDPSYEDKEALNALHNTPAVVIKHIEKQSWPPIHVAAPKPPKRPEPPPDGFVIRC